MKKKRFFAIILLLLSWVVTQAQQSIMGCVETNAVFNSIVRAWNDNLILYAEGPTRQGYFMLVDNFAPNAPVITASVPANVHVHDFRIFEDYLFCVGDSAGTDTVAVTGKFRIEDLFKSGGNIQWNTFPLVYLRDLNLEYAQLSFRRLAVYSYHGTIHLFTIGNVATTYQGQTTYETAIYDIIDGTASYHFTLGSQIHSEGVFFDIANTDNYLVAVAHKGSRTDLTINGYLVMRPFAKDGSPLTSASGSNYFNTDGFTVALDNIRASHTREDNFDIAYMVYTNPGEELEMASLYVDATGTIGSNCYAQTMRPLTSTHQHNLFDMAHLSAHSVTALVGDCNPMFRYQTDLFQNVPNCNAIGWELFMTGFEMNSVCAMTTAKCAICGKYPDGLGVLIQQVLIDHSCATTQLNLSNWQRKEKSTLIPCRVFSSSYHSLSHTPTLSQGKFQIICEK